MLSFILSPDARYDLYEIQDYIAQNNPAAAAKVIDAIYEAFDLLAERPHIGHRREDLTQKDLRFWGVYSYLIIYDPKAEPLSIIRILSGWRDVAGAMG